MGQTSHIIIPARLASTRLPRKLLLRETGKTLLQHTYEAASRAERPGGVCVAADHAEIFDAVRAFGGNVEMTDPQAASGTDRVAEVARRTGPRRSGSQRPRRRAGIGRASPSTWSSRLLEERPAAVMATLATPIRSRRQLEDPACVKVVFDSAGRALLQPQPHPLRRGSGTTRLLDRRSAAFLPACGTVRLSPRVSPGIGGPAAIPLEQVEKLEQLRVLQAGDSIVVGVVDEPTFGIDTPEDYRVFVERWRGKRS